ncbi:1-deoxy-D-xylulose-5-phosphate reductoisomerase [bacterium]|nr:1-deoxy-D-xylulose-5-phosphate reductoisomerase [bacterium]
MSSPKRIVILGSTGSIGTGALSVVAAAPDDFDVVAISAFRSTELLAQQAVRFGVSRMAVGGKENGGASLTAETASTLPDGIEILSGVDALDELASDPTIDVVINALVGSAGLAPAVAAVRAGRRLAIANKESLVAAGELLTALAAETGSTLVPIDSEHSAVFRCLRGQRPDEIVGITLTASGGALRDAAPSSVATATIEDVLRHPTWEMGAKVTVDSATMFNKGLEVLEARWLFGLDLDQIAVVVHRESVVHSFVRLRDGSLLAHLGDPDMRVPIQYAMYYPDSPTVSFAGRTLEEIGALHFEPLDEARHPCFGLALEAGRRGGTAPAIAATADEQAVEAFVAHRIPFGGIATVIEQTLDRTVVGPVESLDAVWEAETEAAAVAIEIIQGLALSN